MTVSSYGSDNGNHIPILDGIRYFYSKIENCNFVPRLEITMTDPVILPFLQTAAEKAMDKYRIFRCVVKSNEYEYYLTDNNRQPVVHVDDETRHTIGTEDNNGHIIWIGINDRIIVIEFFHGLSDMHGTLPFAESLLLHYCQLRYGTNMEDTASYNRLQAHVSEYMDSMTYVDESQKYPVPKRKPTAFQLPEERMDDANACARYSLTVDAPAFDAFMRQNRSSRTSVFTVFMNHAIASVHPDYDFPIIAGVAVDIRKILGAENSLRDCTDTIYLPFDRDLAVLPVDQQLQTVRQMIVDGMEPATRLANAVSTKLNNTRLTKMFPLLEEKIRFCRRLHQYSHLNLTYTISNVGLVDFADALDPYIACVHSVMGASTCPIIIEVVQYKQQYHITYCSRLKNDPYIHAFQQCFLQTGIPCQCKQHKDFYEALAIF